jgi:acyl-[acyl-carrier-protein] desaturase
VQIIDAIYEQDPDGATLAFADMMKKQIVMPAHLMDDGQHETTNKGRNLFAVSAACPAKNCLFTMTS